MEITSLIARKILEYGLEAPRKKVLNIPVDYRNIAKEIYNVPEKPKEFVPKFLEEEITGTTVLVSGGLDSTVSWLMANQKQVFVQAFYVNMGQPYAKKELKAIRKMPISFSQIMVPKPKHLNDGKWKHIHPGRNFYYFTLVSERVLEPSYLVFSAVNGEMPQEGGDKSLKFIEQANQIFSKLHTPVKIITPLKDLTKTDLVKWGVDNGYQEILRQTISCFDPKEERCGCCQSCLRTWIAFTNNDIDLPFKIHPMKGAKKFAEKYKKVMSEALEKKDFSKYSKRRINQTWDAFMVYDSK